MSPKVRASLGVITTLLFAMAGAAFLAEQQTTMGVVLIALACLRGLFAVQQLLAAREA
jgi:hypothetical protein